MKKFSFSLLGMLFLMIVFSSVALANPVQDPPNLFLDHNAEIDGEVVDPPNPNANNTGSGINEMDNFDEVIKAIDGHKTHGYYQNNTNSCASCHQTHTASSDRYLLFADSVYQTCASCHDGTLGFYNVFETGENASINGAGTFGGSHATNMSVHMANDTLTIRAAPGGNPNGSGSWAGTFNCASCHAPHGSYSDRILHTNPNNMAITPASQGGTYLTALTVGNQSSGMHLRRTTVDGFVRLELFNGNTKQVGPWLYGYPAHNQPHFTRIIDGSTNYQYGNEHVYVSFDKGYFQARTEFGNEILNKSTITANVARPYIVKMDLNVVDQIGDLKIYETNQAAYWDGFVVPEDRRAEFTNAGYTVNATTFRTSNLGVRMNQYCATCHTDYFTSRSNSGGSLWGDDTAAYRHSANSDRFSCVRCHYAHGTDVEIMLDANGLTVEDWVASGDKSHEEAINYMMDQNSSSALKKFTNMTSCFACHQSSRATPFKNTDQKTGDAPSGMPRSSDGTQR
ncbi:putative CXXCH cytochrome family protein [Evansella vedderi]|uniref:CXXCH cytochrome family protein n=1 Tax=Evansella vedderi TaxID=38282 RepID=A0ABT9ZZK1_9BACI|nr:cytochrome c3 family protein [Evansella vedderi]MDQ0256669.1 putative CXXCH cytochrome family protein [Evansella vedderi]